MTVRIEAEVPVLFGNVLKNKRRAFHCKCKMAAELVATVLDNTGNPLAFNVPYLEGAEWRARFVEAACRISQLTEAGVTVDADNSTVNVVLPSNISDMPGVYELSVAALRDGGLLASNEYFVYVEPSMWADNVMSFSALPTIDRVRLSLRDSDPLENELLHNKQFFLTDISYAVIAATQFYNSSLPTIPRLLVDTTCFPDADLFMTGIRTFLFMNMLDHYRKNTLLYQSGNISIDDNKLREYAHAYQEELKRYEQQCLANKAARNLRGAARMTRGCLR